MSTGQLTKYLRPISSIFLLLILSNFYSQVQKSAIHEEAMEEKLYALCFLQKELEIS